MSTSEGRTCITHHVVHKTVKQARRTHCSGMKFYLLLVCHTLWGGRRSIRAIKSKYSSVFTNVCRYFKKSYQTRISSNLPPVNGPWSIRDSARKVFIFIIKCFWYSWDFLMLGYFLVPSSTVCSAGLIWDFWIMFSNLKLVAQHEPKHMQLQ